eukprot:TRINITY_DN10395_c0_g2_i1.p1 TRINITY_DN10395_c0_g2~~TRINITY_DN10395_c0_g2_i1.p1  ORF type:complete len:257 (-),score=13.84 TRINITY_DN10395_c0_g2_i1:222-992(-)
MRRCKRCRSVFPRKEKGKNRSNLSLERLICKRCGRRRSTGTPDSNNANINSDQSISREKLVCSKLYLVQDTKNIDLKRTRDMDVYFGALVWVEDLVLDSGFVTNSSNNNLGILPSTELLQTRNGYNKVFYGDNKKNQFSLSTQLNQVGGQLGLDDACSQYQITQNGGKIHANISNVPMNQRTHYYRKNQSTTKLLQRHQSQNNGSTIFIDLTLEDDCKNSGVIQNRDGLKTQKQDTVIVKQERLNFDPLNMTGRRS